MLADKIGYIMEKSCPESTLLNRIKKADKFVLDHTAIEAVRDLGASNPSSILTALSFAVLPYPLTWIETPENPTGILLEQVGDGPAVFKMTIVYMEADGLGVSLNPISVHWDGLNPITPPQNHNMYLDWNQQKRQPGREELEEKIKKHFAFVINNYLEENQHPSQVEAAVRHALSNAHDLQSITSGLLTTINYLIVLQCKNRIEVELTEQSKINKKRKKRGKLPLFEYRTVRINLHGHRSPSDKSARPGRKYRMHAVRGHFKVRKTGVYWWSPFIRGDEKTGKIVHSRYDVTK